jgi:hypothetical protein
VNSTQSSGKMSNTRLQVKDRQAFLCSNASVTATIHKDMILSLTIRNILMEDYFDSGCGSSVTCKCNFKRDIKDISSSFILVYTYFVLQNIKRLQLFF